MKIQSCLLFVYRLMLVCYPPSFRKRFAPEMLELAAAAEATEWPANLRRYRRCHRSLLAPRVPFDGCAAGTQCLCAAQRIAD
jgi:hypothetical protein